MQTLITHSNFLASLIPLWSILLAIILMCFSRNRGWGKPVTVTALFSGIIALFPLIPINQPLQQHGKPRQIVYRFDDHRYLELEGYECEGAVDYVDTKRGFRTNLASQYWRVPLIPITHADNDGDFIFVPNEDASGGVSRDGGRSFENVRWVEPRTFGVELIKSITVVNRQAFISGKDGRMWMTSLPFGQGWGLEVIDPVNELPNTIHRDFPQYQNLPKTIPPIKGYNGWTKMHCDPSLESPELPSDGNSLYEWQQRVRTGLGLTVALPVTLAAWALEGVVE